MGRKLGLIITFLLVLSFSLVTATPASASSTVTPAAGGGAISADTATGAPGEAWTTLGAITISEGASGDIAVGTFVLTIPSGFEFNTASVPDVVVTGTTPQLAATSSTAITATTITVTVTAASTTETDNGLIIGGGVTPIQVRPTTGAPLASGNILMTTGTITGVDGATNFGTLGMIPGAAPTFSSAATSTDGTKITITFSKAMANPSGKHAQFSFKIGVTGRTFYAAALNADTAKIDLTVDGAAIANGDVVTVSYTKGTVLAADGGVLESFTDQTVTNNVPPPAPTVTSLSANYGYRGQQTMYVSIYGHYFTGATAVSFGVGITVNNFGVFSDTWILTRISIAANATPGLRDVSVTTPGGTRALAGGFTVSETAVSTKVISPNGGESWEIGTQRTITWTSSGLIGINDKINIQLSRDGGQTWKNIMVATTNDGYEDWKVTGPPTIRAKIKVFSAASPYIFDISDANFIISAPTIKGTFPNGGESWNIGTKQTITWTTSPGFTGKVKFQLSRDGGTTWKNISSSTVNYGFKDWKVTGPPTNYARIKIVSLSNKDIFDISDANFIISAGIIWTTAPFGGESWTIGTKQTITWTSNDIVGKVTIQLSRDGGETWTTIISSTSNDGFEKWKVTGLPTNQARIKVLSKSYPTVFDISDANFTIRRR